MSLRELFAGTDRPGSFAARARSRRWEELVRTFPAFEDMAVLDLGGTEEFWQLAPVRPARVTLLNPAAPPTGSDWIETVSGDACDPPSSVARERFDLVYSNSTIEHVGGHARRQRFADVVRASAPRAWVQTPNRYFPVEAHFVLPFGQQLPVRLRTYAARHWPLRPSGFPADDREAALAEILDIELLSRTELRWYFPDATIVRERVAGLTKSLVAIRSV